MKFLRKRSKTMTKQSQVHVDNMQKTSRSAQGYCLQLVANEETGVFSLEKNAQEIAY